jgi:ribosomal-protein-alanine N-acetyltransferase
MAYSSVVAFPLTLTTERLLLRRWRPEDKAEFAKLNADPEVMRYFPAPLSKEQSDAFADRIAAHFDAHGFGLWVAELTHGRHFAGFVGLSTVNLPTAFCPCVEIGWRLARHHWGHGYATEAAERALAFAFEQLQLAQVVSFTSVAHRRSRAVMERLGMQHSADDDFEHPRLPERHPLRAHVLYRLRAASWADRCR